MACRFQKSSTTTLLKTRKYGINNAIINIIYYIRKKKESKYHLFILFV